jgi:hypothetical protein
VRLAGSPTSPGVSSVVLVPPLAGGDPGRVGRGPSVETLLDFLFQKIRHQVEYRFNADIIEEQWVGIRLRGHRGPSTEFCSMLPLVLIHAMLI